MHDVSPDQSYMIFLKSVKQLALLLSKNLNFRQLASDELLKITVDCIDATFHLIFVILLNVCHCHSVGLYLYLYYVFCFMGAIVHK